MHLQTSIISAYQKINGNPSLREVSKSSGIQITRVFRIFNGAEMKLSEYEIFTMLINESRGEKNTLIALAEKCSIELSSKEVGLLSTLMSRKLCLTELFKNKTMAKAA